MEKGCLPQSRVVLNSSMNWNEVSIHTTPNSYPESATPSLVIKGVFGG